MRKTIGRGRINRRGEFEINDMAAFRAAIADGFCSHITISATKIKAKGAKPKSGKPKRESNSQIEGRLNEAFSKFVRAKAGHACEIHKIAEERGIALPFKCSDTLQCCHKFSRKYRAIKYDLKNVYCGCDSGNLWAHYNEVKWYELWKSIWHTDYARLDWRKAAGCSRNRRQMLDMIDYFTSELKKLL